MACTPAHYSSEETADCKIVVDPSVDTANAILNILLAKTGPTNKLLDGNLDEFEEASNLVEQAVTLLKETNEFKRVESVLSTDLEKHFSNDKDEDGSGIAGDPSFANVSSENLPSELESEFSHKPYTSEGYQGGGLRGGRDIDSEDEYDGVADSYCVDFDYDPRDVLNLYSENDRIIDLEDEETSEDDLDDEFDSEDDYDVEDDYAGSEWDSHDEDEDVESDLEEASLQDGTNGIHWTVAQNNIASANDRLYDSDSESESEICPCCLARQSANRRPRLHDGRGSRHEVESGDSGAAVAENEAEDNT